MSRGVVHIQWYATVFRGNLFVEAVSEWAAPVSLNYGATRYAVQRSLDDPYRILQQVWFEDHDDWYRYWDGPEMIEFRARYMGKYQIPITYVWYDEYAAGGAPPSTVKPTDLMPESEPTPSGIDASSTPAG
jgi:hypothetical protein